MVEVAMRGFGDLFVIGIILLFVGVMYHIWTASTADAGYRYHGGYGAYHSYYYCPPTYRTYHYGYRKHYRHRWRRTYHSRRYFKRRSCKVVRHCDWKGCYTKRYCR